MSQFCNIRYVVFIVRINKDSYYYYYYYYFFFFFFFYKIKSFIDNKANYKILFTVNFT